jgi:hypothetical protein
MNEARSDLQTPARPNGSDPDHAPGGAIVDAVRVFDHVETASIGRMTASETAQQRLDSSRDSFERTLDAAISVSEASARFVERVVIRSLETGSEMGGALRGALRRDGNALVAVRSPGPDASEHAQVPS